LKRSKAIYVRVSGIQNNYKPDPGNSYFEFSNK
jgi:hypothetical protein